MSDSLDLARVLIVTANTGVEHDELVQPRDLLRERGARVVHAAPDAGDVRTFRHDVEPHTVEQADAALDQVDAADFDILVVPGGTVNADKLRVSEHAQRLVRECAEAGKPIAALCHGPWLLVEADVVRGKTLTSYPSLRTDITNAGGNWRDESAVRSNADGWTLITSRNPRDLPNFIEAIADELIVAV